MSIAVIALASAALGCCVRRWWLVLLPLVLGGVTLGLVLGWGSPPDRDTPIAFVASVATLSTALGVLAGRRLPRAT